MVGRAPVVATHSTVPEPRTTRPELSSRGALRSLSRGAVLLWLPAKSDLLRIRYSNLLSPVLVVSTKAGWTIAVESGGACRSSPCGGSHARIDAVDAFNRASQAIQPQSRGS